MKNKKDNKTIRDINRMIKVEFNVIEYNLLTYVGVARHNCAKFENLQDYFEGPHGYETHGIGAPGEAAVGKWLRQYWDFSIGETGGIDIGDHYQVRTSEKPKSGLLIKGKDNDDQIFIQVLSHLAPTLYLSGWYYAGEAKQDKWRYEDTGNFYVPQNYTRDMLKLPIYYNGPMELNGAGSSPPLNEIYRGVNYER